MPVNSLTEQHFALQQSQKKNVMMLKVQGPVVVFFKTRGCASCAKFEPIFAGVANSDNRVQYGVIDLSVHANVAKMSASTTTPIQAVPFILLYLNGKPFARFTGKKDAASLSSFIAKALATASGAPSPPTKVNYGAPVMQSTRGGGGGNATPPKMSNGQYTLDEVDDEECLITPMVVIPYNINWMTMITE